MRPNHICFTAGYLIAASALALGCERSNPPSGPDVQPPGPDLPAIGPDVPATGPRTGQLAYSELDNGIWRVTLLNLDGTGSVHLADGVAKPDWSPDGRRLVFSDTRCETDWSTYEECVSGGLLIMDVETGKLTALAGTALGEHAAWNPAGDLIAFIRYTASGRRLFVMSADGGLAEELETSGVSEAFEPSWSPDGQRIVFQCWRVGFGICVINKDGTGLTQLSIFPLQGSAVSPSWSPDGTRIAFAVLNGGKGTIAMMAPDGTGAMAIAEGLDPAWSRDGGWLAFSRSAEGLYTVKADGSNLRRLTTGIHNSPAWRP